MKAMGDIFKNRNFRLLWTGESISLLGDQLYMVALPWLVLQLTGNALATGTVLALAAVPRALFMLVGGALTDRFSPRAVMLVSNGARMLLVSALAAVTLSSSVHLWMLYAFALLFGLADAFFFPAQTAIVPRLIGKEHLQTGNAIIQGTAQLSVCVGPALAGLLIALLDGGAGAVADGRGLGVAFAIDAVSFLASVLCLSLMRLGSKGTLVENEHERQTLFSSIAEGLSVVWHDRLLRYYFVLIAAVNLFVTGPISVGIPVLAETRLSQGAAAFGIILSAFGAGAFAGIILAGTTPRPTARRFPALMLGSVAILGVALPLLGMARTMVPAVIAASVMGCAQGYIVIQFVTWLQLRTPARMLGRTMSLLMFAVVGMTPLSNTISGALIDMNVTGVFVGAGVLTLGIVLAGALSPSVWRLGSDEHDTAGRPAEQGA